MLYKKGRLHTMCLVCIIISNPTNDECKECEHDLRQEYADYPGDCRGVIEDEE